MRISLLTLAVVVAIGLGAVAAVSILIGFAEQRAADNTYVVQFSHPGAECGSGAQAFDVATGDALSCALHGVGAGDARARFPGFTDEQNDQVAGLAKDLGADGVSAAEQQRIQQLVDKFAATVPEAARPHYDEGVSLGPLWGAGLAWTGVGVVVVCVLACFAILRSTAVRQWVRRGG